MGQLFSSSNANDNKYSGMGAQYAYMDNAEHEKAEKLRVSEDRKCEELKIKPKEFINTRMDKLNGNIAEYGDWTEKYNDWKNKNASETKKYNEWKKKNTYENTKWDTERKEWGQKYKESKEEYKTLRKCNNYAEKEYNEL